MFFGKLFPCMNIFRSRIHSGRLFVRNCSGDSASDCVKNTGEEEKLNEVQGSGGEGNKFWVTTSQQAKASHGRLQPSLVALLPHIIKTDTYGSGLVLGVYESGDKFELTPAAEEINQKSGGKLCRYLNEISCQLKPGKAFVVTDVVPEFGPVALSALGKKDPGYNKLEDLDETRENVRVMVGAGVQALSERGCERIAVEGAAATDAAAEAAHLAAWRFEEFKSCGARAATPQLSLYGGEGQEAWGAGSVLGRSQNWARFLSDMPANKMTPVDLAQAAIDVLCPLGVRVTAFERPWIEAQRMEAFLAVARGSCEPPLFLQCEYTPAGNTPPVLIAAKGITFDSGGLCLKKPELMQEMRGSMAGAAVTLATLRALAELKVQLNVCAVIPLCENMVSGQCMKVGDVVRALNGLSLQIEDTDMEGRLALADALVYGQVLFKPSLVIDVATLTRGVLLATGGGAFGCFSNCESAWRAMRDAGAHTGDRGWRFPLWDFYQKQIDNDAAVDLRNKGSGTATPCIGAAFLKNFICGDWLHVDMTGVGRVTLASGASHTYLRARRMSGRPTRTLVAFLAAAAHASAAGDSGAAGKLCPAPADV